ncbi:hypothetical protein FALCPG4_007699 [Fusarium falciforme]
MLQCTSYTRIWQSVPFYAQSDANNMDVPNFTLRFKAPSDDPTQPVQNCQLHIVSSGVVEVFANGASATIDTEGKWYQADAFIVVSVIVSTADMSPLSSKWISSRLLGAILWSSRTMPNGKLNSKLASIQHADDLLNAKTQTGDPLITPGAVSQQDAEQAAAMINQFNKTQIFLGRPGQPLKRNDNSPKLYNPKTKRPTIIAGIVGENTPRERERFLDKMSGTSWYGP